MTSPNLSHYYISKKPLLVSQSFGRLVLAVWSWADWPNFERLVMVFLKYKNGSNLERSLLSTIQSYVANPSKMKFFLITLFSMNQFYFLRQVYLTYCNDQQKHNWLESVHEWCNLLHELILWKIEIIKY